MTRLPFRQHHLVRLLSSYEEQSIPLDLFVNNYFRSHKALGASDRKEIAETVYGIVRWRGLVNALCGSSATLLQRLECYRNLEPIAHIDREDLPLSARYSCPEELFRLLEQQYGESQTKELCLVANTAAPTTVRVNALKISREALFSRWQAAGYAVVECEHAPLGIMFKERPNLFSLAEFAQGLFEMQDEASQLVAELVRAQPGEQVLDFCSGSGGKTLAFAPRMQQKGQIFVHDIRPRILQEARKRLRRAGIQNVQLLSPTTPHLNRLKRRMDWILVDVPCTGTGTLRRNPDLKWKFNDALLSRLIGEQRLIFKEALSYLKPNGTIVYATCSLLRQENQEQIDYFTQTHGLRLHEPLFQTIPTVGGMDGFFGAVLKLNLNGQTTIKGQGQ